jgi:hypothetical protein
MLALLVLLAAAYEPVEPAPAEYAALPFEKPGVVERYFHSPAGLDRFCRDHLQAELADGAHFRACYVPHLDLIALPSRWAVPNAQERADLRAHEWAHAWGWRHPAPPLDMKRLMAAWEAKQASR